MRHFPGKFVEPSFSQDQKLPIHFYENAIFFQSKLISEMSLGTIDGANTYFCYLIFSVCAIIQANLQRTFLGKSKNTEVKFLNRAIKSKIHATFKYVFIV